MQDYQTPDDEEVYQELTGFSEDRLDTPIEQIPKDPHQ